MRVFHEFVNKFSDLLLCKLNIFYLDDFLHIKDAYFYSF